MAESIDGESGQHLLMMGMMLLSDIPFTTIFITLFLLLLSGLISGSEVAYFSLTAEQINQCKESEKKQEQRVFKLLQNPKGLLATVLILNNLVNVGIVTLSTYASWEIATSIGVAKDGPILTFILTVIVTAAIVFFGEIVPKVYAAQKNLEFAKLVASFLSGAVNILSPFAITLTSLGDFLERRLKKKGIEVSVNELNEAVEIVTAEEDSIYAEGILKGIVNFGSTTVTQVMKSRIDIEAVDISADFNEVMAKINTSGFSRIPVYDETIDNIQGMLYIKDLLPHIDNSNDFNWQELIRREIFFIPENKKIDELLRDFQQKRVHIAIIVDEYGGTTGLVTMEDIIEEIVGEINDEFDDVIEDSNYRKLNDSTFIFDGKTPLIDFAKIADIDMEVMDEAKGESESLGGLLLEFFRKMPKTGEKVSFQHLTFTVMEVDNKRIKTVKVFFNTPPTSFPEEKKVELDRH